MYTKSKKSLMKLKYYILYVFLSVILFLIFLFPEHVFSQNKDINDGIKEDIWKVVEIEGAIDPAITDFIIYELKHTENLKAIVIKMNTPGGLLDSMQKIVESILNCEIPVIVWVGPSGATAASAGTFITLASDIAVMAPSTMIGAASPVSLMGESSDKQTNKTMERKIMNFSVTYITMLAKRHHRNANWAKLAVTEAASLQSEEALKLKVIDYIASNIDDLKSILNGKKVIKNGKTFIFRKDNVSVKFKKTPFFIKLRHILANPSIAYIFLTLGVLAFIYEFSTPGVGFGLISGIVFLSLAFYSLSVLPVNYAGVILFFLGVLMIILDLYIPSHGLLTIGGAIIMFLGSMFLIKSVNPIFKISLPVIIVVTGSFVLFAVYVIKKLLDLRKKNAITGDIGIKGLEGIVKKWDKNDKIVFVRGEYWMAQPYEEVYNNKNLDDKNLEKKSDLKVNDRIKVIDKKGNILIVKKL